MPLLSTREDSDEKLGFVYILSNPSFPGLLKVGFTLRDVQQRVDELSASTSVPYSFQEELSLICEDPEKIERRIHGRLHRYRVNPKKEFFKISKREAQAALINIVTGLDVEEENITRRVLVWAVFVQLFKTGCRFPEQFKDVNDKDPLRSLLKQLRKGLAQALPEGDEVRGEITQLIDERLKAISLEDKT